MHMQLLTHLTLRFAEVLKYLYVYNMIMFFSVLNSCRYLTFDDPEHISLDDCALSFLW
jgi:hypothetical protein